MKLVIGTLAMVIIASAPKANEFGGSAGLDIATDGYIEGTSNLQYALPLDEMGRINVALGAGAAMGMRSEEVENPWNSNLTYMQTRPTFRVNGQVGMLFGSIEDRVRGGGAIGLDSEMGTYVEASGRLSLGKDHATIIDIDRDGVRRTQQTRDHYLYGSYRHSLSNPESPGRVGVGLGMSVSGRRAQQQ